MALRTGERKVQHLPCGESAGEFGQGDLDLFSCQEVVLREIPWRVDGVLRKDLITKRRLVYDANASKNNLNDANPSYFVYGKIP